MARSGTTGYRPGAKMDRWAKKLRDPSVVLKQIGAVMVAESQDAFQQQAFGNKPWAPRGKVNTFGVLADLAKGSTPPNRRFQTRPALIDTGRLRASIAFRVSSSTVTVGSNLPYASAHHTGEEVESEEITQEMQDLLWDWLQGGGSDHKSELGWLLNKRLTGTRLTMRLPERPIVGITAQTFADVREIVGVEIFEVRR